VKRTLSLLASVPVVVFLLACSGESRVPEGNAADGTPSGAAPVSAAAGDGIVLPPGEGKLIAEPLTRDLGDVPIGGGKVQTSFMVRNDSDEAVRLVSVYTSCMCTTAVLAFEDGPKEGPFGMPGHDLPTSLDRSLGAGQTMEVEVTFDPAAHGPDAVGPVTRGIAIHLDDGEVLILQFNANVVR